MSEHRISEGYNILQDGDFCAECGETWPCSEERVNLLTTDLQRIAHELGIPARTYSGHEAMERDILPEIRRLKQKVRLADHIVTRLGRRPVANGDYRGYAWAQAEAELSVLIEQYQVGGQEVTGG